MLSFFCCLLGPLCICATCLAFGAKFLDFERILEHRQVDASFSTAEMHATAAAMATAAMARAEGGVSK
jgi:hypothetical protein